MHFISSLNEFFSVGWSSISFTTSYLKVSVQLYEWLSSYTFFYIAEYTIASIIYYCCRFIYSSFWLYNFLCRCAVEDGVEILDTTTPLIKLTIPRIRFRGAQYPGVLVKCTLQACFQNVHIRCKRKLCINNHNQRSKINTNWKYLTTSMNFSLNPDEKDSRQVSYLSSYMQMCVVFIETSRDLSDLDFSGSDFCSQLFYICLFIERNSVYSIYYFHTNCQP